MNADDGLKIEHAAAVMLRDAIRQHMRSFSLVSATAPAKPLLQPASTAWLALWRLRLWAAMAARKMLLTQQ